MHRILFLPEIQPAGYMANLKAGYRISGWISGAGRITEIIKWEFIEALFHVQVMIYPSQSD
jgi:hypothetical protein